MSQDKPSAACADLVRKKDLNENKIGLLKQSTNILNSTKPTSTSPAFPTTSAATTTVAGASASTGASSSGVTMSSLNKKLQEPERDTKPTNLKLTLESDKLREQFRTFLRTKLDQNKSDNLEHKKMFEQWLEFVLICNKVFELPETDLEIKTTLMVTVGDKFLAKPPDGYNIALKSQLNRKELVNHCRSLSEKVPDLSPNQDLLKDGYEFIFGKLEQKHDLFKKTYVQTTKLAALLCSVL